MITVYNWILLVIHLSALLTVDGCGQIPAGREKNINFTVTNFALPAIMAYSQEPADKVKEPTISTTKGEAEAFVRSLIMRSVEDVLYQQGQSAFLPDYLISSILQQLDVQITYDPLKCENVITEPYNQAGNGGVGMKTNCIIIGGTVTNTCFDSNANGMMCMHGMIGANLKSILSKHLVISGSLKTSNSVMANWSNQMWQSVLNRVLRSITTGQNGSYFYGASVNLN